MKNATNTLIFDVDGTLAETEELHRKAFNETFKRNNLSWYWDKSLYGNLLKIAGGKERIKFYDANFSKEKNYLDYQYISELHQEKTKLYTNFLEGGVLTLRPGISSIITNALYRGLRLAVATSTSRINLVSLTENCLGKKPDEIFTFVATGDLVDNKKPAADLYNLVLQEISIDASECLALEDSRIGLIAAKAANIKTLVSPSFYHMSEDFSESDYLCQSFEEEQLPEDLCQLLFQ